MGFLSNLFKRKKKQKTLEEILREVKVGDLVFVKFKGPDQIGIVSGQDLSFTRISREEASKKAIEGTVSSIRMLGDDCVGYFLVEIATYSSPSFPGQLRKITLLQDEIVEIRKANA